MCRRHIFAWHRRIAADPREEALPKPGDFAWRMFLINHQRIAASALLTLWRNE